MTDSDESDATPEEEEAEDDEILTTPSVFSLKESFSTMNLVERSTSDGTGVFVRAGGDLDSLEPSLSCTGLLAGGLTSLLISHVSLLILAVEESACPSRWNLST